MVTLLPLYVSSCRTMLASAGRVDLSERVAALLGSHESELGAEDFGRVLQFVRLCPEHGADREGIRAIAVYYRIVELGARLIGKASPGWNAWSERELGQCAHFAAVVLDRSISSSRRMIMRPASDQL